MTCTPSHLPLIIKTWETWALLLLPKTQVHLISKSEHFLCFGTFVLLSFPFPAALPVFRLDHFSSVWPQPLADLCLSLVLPFPFLHVPPAHPQLCSKRKMSKMWVWSHHCLDIHPLMVLPNLQDQSPEKILSDMDLTCPPHPVPLHSGHPELLTTLTHC